MPDVFVAKDDPQENDVVMHKRTPLPSDQQSTQQIPQTPVAQQEIAQESTLDEKPTEENQDLVQKQKIVLEREVPLTQVEKNAPPPVRESEITSEILVDDAERRNGIPLFTSFWQNPQGVYFDTQEANEHILLFLRRHFVTNIPWIFMTIIFLFLPIVVNYLVKVTNFSLAVFPAPFLSASLIMYYLVVLTAGFLRFLGWYFNISLITARRVMDIELKDLVYKKISATKISLVQDVNYQQTGTIRTVFNYGDVLVQTAGATDNFFINAVPRPEVVVQVLEALIGRGTEEKDNATL